MMTTDTLGSDNVRLVTQPTPRAALLWLFCGSALLGAEMAAWHGPWGLLVALLANIVLDFLIFLWYCRDSNLRRFKRTIWWNIAMVGLLVPTLFIYLWRTRARGQRLRAMLWALACFLLALLATGLGGVTGLIVSKLI